MPLSRRSRLSLAQYLTLQPDDPLDVLLKKYDLPHGWPPSENIGQLCTQAEEHALLAVLDEVSRTSGDLRSHVNPKYQYDERASDLVRCLELDGYRLTRDGLQQIEPTLEGQVVYEDDLSRALRACNLPEAGEVQAALDQSAEAFRRQPQDFNASLTLARIALQTLATSIATTRAEGAVGFDPTKWGQVVANLRTSGFITEPEEKGLAGVFTFVSPGAHQHIAVSQEEMTRLGRSMVISMCYFLVKTYTG
jgi:hypothetical protein